MEHRLLEEKELFKRFEIVETAEASEKAKNRILKEKAKVVESRVFVKGVTPPSYFGGYRKGHLPPNVIERYVGGKAVCYTAFFNELYKQFIEETKLNVCHTVGLNDEHIVKCEPFSETKIVVELEVYPDIPDFDYKGFEFVEKDTDPTKDEIETSLNMIKKKHRNFVEDDLKEVSNEDAVYISFTGNAVLSNGKTQKIEEVKSILVVLGESDYIASATAFLPFFERNLIGAKMGKNLVRFVLPQEGMEKELKGAEINLDVVVEKIGHMEMPDLNDELVKKISDGKFESFEKFMKDLKASIKKRKETINAQGMEEEIFSGLTKTTGNFPLPESMVDSQAIILTVNRLESVAKGVPLEKFIKEKKVDFEGLKKSNLKIAGNLVRRNLIFKKIAEKEGIKITDELIKEEIESNDAYGRMVKDKLEKPSVDQLKQVLKQSGKYSQFCDDLLVSRVTQLIKDNAVFKKEEK